MAAMQFFRERTLGRRARHLRPRNQTASDQTRRAGWRAPRLLFVPDLRRAKWARGIPVLLEFARCSRSNVGPRCREFEDVAESAAWAAPVPSPSIRPLDRRSAPIPAPKKLPARRRCRYGRPLVE